jgi:hypothetical protein
VRRQVLGPPAPVVARPRAAPPALRAGPLRAVGAAPGGALAARLVEGDGGMDSLVGIDTNGDPELSFPVPDSALRPRGQGSRVRAGAGSY